MDETRIKEQRKEIDKPNESFDESGDNFHIFQGAEVNIKSDGKLDMPDAVLKQVEIVLASIHGGFSDSSEKITMRLISAMENENVDIIAHPTGRLIFERSGYSFDLRKIIETAKTTQTILEIDGHANRLDLNDENASEVIKAGVLMSVDTDSHESVEMDYMLLGVGQARRAWARKQDILNTSGREEVEAYLEI
jgi:DNA polymerase (family 10)